MKTKASAMKTKARITLFGLVMVIALCYVNFANAESNFATGAGPQNAAVNLDFQIVIPRFVYFRVGTAGVAIDTINFSPTATDVATPGASTAGTGGDVGGGAVNVDLISNGGNIAITPTNDGGGSGLSDGGTNYISYAQIISADGGNITAPTLTNAGGAVVNILSAGVTVLSDIWTYTYSNPATPPVAGTYTGRVTYTAAIP